MTLKEQEVLLIKKIESLHNEEDIVRKMLAAVRGGSKIIESKEIDRPDEFILKS